ncbi:helix-turn-helix transcriptional regulator [Enterococcus hulanensis]|uniref:Helix-turn-helix transcriptional regulator n=1 Tax=Enterococcus hulanensis TaxID=2559929 RepID=A0ABU3F1Z2_9ENTE|nr:helix-turn-helix transcriptional regulator [Enterococcus hulanensis]MDT2600951.1 helix-turn-helix transcriptional regulator [Enterococcus hulanensis]MDT2611539.1 helix-turn-helix transcriptional regulator [Enterococcus hulanensis]MDT2617976.1 helix-turn-helix transcriptional regulator [Enterococcus hulanensis]MDT2628979.1 helix-turn-helix transcriptional regulator [Enterococcus hulanensis]MDT2656541.1 helix-turn-helix transcriptional regulator [Enterococcus hulanensis]
MKNLLGKIAKDENISLTKLSKDSGIGRTTLSELANSSDVPAKTKVSTLIKVCKCLQKSLTDVFFEEIFYEIVFFKKLGNDYEINEDLVDLLLEFETDIYFCIIKITKETRTDYLAFSISVPIYFSSYELTIELINELDMSIIRQNRTVLYDEISKFQSISLISPEEFIKKYDIDQVSELILLKLKKEFLKSIAIHDKLIETARNVEPSFEIEVSKLLLYWNILSFDIDFMNKDELISPDDYAPNNYIYYYDLKSDKFCHITFKQKNYNISRWYLK